MNWELKMWESIMIKPVSYHAVDSMNQIYVRSSHTPDDGDHGRLVRLKHGHHGHILRRF